MKTIKILAITEKNSGSHYWRLDYPIGKINGNEVGENKLNFTLSEFSENTFKDMENYDILLFEWDIALTVQQLGELQARGKKIVYSVDDFWEFSEIHPYYSQEQKRVYTANRVKQLLLLADAVIVTTERLALNVLQFNKNIAILPNFINPEDFKQFSKKTESRKLRLGFIGSVSHYPDYLMFKQVLNKLAKNKNIAENCQFQLCGVSENNPAWNTLIDMFKKKKNIDFVVKEKLPLDRFMEFYQDCDVCLVPLEYTEFNENKSALKLGECLATNTIALGSSLYSTKELKGLVVADDPLQYEQSIEKLLDKQYYNSVLEHVNKVNSEDNNWQQRLENTKLVFNTVFMDDLSSKMDNVNLYSIKYKDEQATEYTPVMNVNTEKGWRFEYQVFLDKLEEIKNLEGFVSFLSWKFPYKTGLTKNILAKHAEYKQYKDYDFVIMNHRYWDSTYDYLQFSYKQHPGLEEILKKVINHLDKEFKYDNKNYVYSNFFMCKSEIMVDYIQNWLIPAINYMENDIWELVNQDANYESGLTKEEFKKLTNLDFYNFLTFVLERLPAFYLQNNNYKVLNLL